MGKNKGLKWYYEKLYIISQEITDKKYKQKEKAYENNKNS